jgi:pyruvate dehydrogenase E2 component (dihydrolipoamide acetyltransferase)
VPESVLLPALGESVTEGTVTRWLKSVGDTVAVDEPLVEVSTDKVDTEIPSPFAGILESIMVGEDKTAEVGSVLALIGSSVIEPVETPVVTPPAGQSSLGGGPERPLASVAPPAETPAPPVVEPVETALVESVETGFRQAQSPKAESHYVTPMVRKLARTLNVDLSTVTGTGIGGRVRKQDVLAAAPAPKVTSVGRVTAAVVPASQRGTVEKAPRIRKVIAQRMRESLQTSTQLTQVHEVDVTGVVRLRARAKADFAAKNGVNLTFLPFIAMAVAEALRTHPVLNAAFDEAAGTVTYHDAEHLAFAVDTPKGLLVPVVRDAGTLNLAGLARGIADVAGRTRNGSIGADELSGGTFSITNIGSVGALFDTPIINQPQVGILGVGAIVKRAVVRPDGDGNDALAVRSMMYLCLTYDHRLVDGADAGRFLQTVTARLEAAAYEAELGL